MMNKTFIFLLVASVLSLTNATAQYVRVWLSIRCPIRRDILYIDTFYLDTIGIRI